MRRTPHYPPAQPNTSARVDYYNAYSSDRASQDEALYDDNYDNYDNYNNGTNRDTSKYNNSNPPTSSTRASNRHRSSVNAAPRATRSSPQSSPVPPPQPLPQQQRQQRLYRPSPQQQQQQQQQSTRYTPDQPQYMNDDFNNVVYTVQDTYTDTQAHETEYGGVLTIRTTTVTRTITERMVCSDDDEDSSDDDGEVHLEKEYRE